MYWTNGSGTLELKLTKSDIRVGHHQGACDDDIAWLSTVPRIAKQLQALSPVVLKQTLREYGAWNSVELEDHEQNLKRILWIACGDLCDEQQEA